MSVKRKSKKTMKNKEFRTRTLKAGCISIIDEMRIDENFCLKWSKNVTTNAIELMPTNRCPDTKMLLFNFFGSFSGKVWQWYLFTFRQSGLHLESRQDTESRKVPWHFVILKYPLKPGKVHWRFVGLGQTRVRNIIWFRRS